MDLLIPFMPADIILTMFHGRPGRKRDAFLSKLITWAPRWKNLKATRYSHAMMVVADAETVLSAERGRVRYVSLESQYLKPEYSILVVRPVVMNRESPPPPPPKGPKGRTSRVEQEASKAFYAWRLKRRARCEAVAAEMMELHGRRYSYIGILGHSLDALLLPLIGGMTNKRPVAWILGKMDRGVYCSESVALSFSQALGRGFLRFRTVGRVLDAACRPRDIEWTAAALGWEIVLKTDHGKLVKPEYCVGKPKMRAMLNHEMFNYFA